MLVIVPAPSFCAVSQRFFQRERQALRIENSVALLRELTLSGTELTKVVSLQKVVAEYDEDCCGE